MPSDSMGGPEKRHGDVIAGERDCLRELAISVTWSSA
jgi:hypothetical protein